MYANTAWAKQYVLYLNAGTLTEKRRGICPDRSAARIKWRRRDRYGAVVDQLYVAERGGEPDVASGAGNLNGTGQLEQHPHRKRGQQHPHRRRWCQYICLQRDFLGTMHLQTSIVGRTLFSLVIPSSRMSRP